jgi:hypothetical protein
LARQRSAGQFLLVIIATAFVVANVSAQKSLQKQFEVAGLTLMKAEMGDVERTLGAATAFRSRESHFSERCYASDGKDGTVLVLEDWAGTLVGFRIYHVSLNSTEKCTRTPAVSAQLATAGGLRLGLTRAEVLELLGAPSKRTENSITYHEDVRSQTPGNEGLFEYTDVDLRFINSRLTSIHIVHTVRE